MSGIVLIIAVGVSVTSFVAFAIHILAPTDETSRTEARLQRLAERQRHQFDPEASEDSFVSLLRSDCAARCHKQQGKQPQAATLNKRLGPLGLSRSAVRLSRLSLALSLRLSLT